MLDKVISLGGIAVSELAFRAAMSIYSYFRAKWLLFRKANHIKLLLNAL